MIFFFFESSEPFHPSALGTNNLLITKYKGMIECYVEEDLIPKAPSLPR